MPLPDAVPIQEAAKADPALRDILARIEAGELVADAPFPGMHEPWTDEAKERLRKALQQRFPHTDGAT